MKNNVLFWTIFFMYTNVVGSENQSEKESAAGNITTVEVIAVHNSIKDIELPSGEKIRVNLRGIHNSTVNMYTHPSNKQIFFDGHGIHHSSIYSYGTNNP